MICLVSWYNILPFPFSKVIKKISFRHHQLHFFLLSGVFSFFSFFILTFFSYFCGRLSPKDNTMRKIILICSLLTVVLTVSAQDAFREAIKAYVRACPAGTVGMTSQMEKALSLVNTTMVKDFNGQQPEALLKKYMETMFLDHFTEYFLAPVMEGHVTTAELNELTKAMLTPQGKLFQAHQVKVNEKGGSEVEKLGKDLGYALLEGKLPEPVALRKDCPKSYAELYNKFYDASDQDKIIEPVIAALRKNSQVENDEFFKGVEKYLRDNIKPLSINYSYGILTADDLKFGITTCGSAAYHHCIESLQNISQVAQSGAMKLVMGYMEWLGEQGVKITE